MTDDELIEAVRVAVSDRGLPPPASPADVARAEAAIGHTLPHLLRRLYLEVADGGFGIWQCVSLTDNGEWYSDEQDIIEVHGSWAASIDPVLPPGVVPLMDRGCAMWTLVDFKTPEGHIWDWDPNDCCVLVPTTLSLAQWLTGWLEGWIQPGPYTQFRIHEENCPSRGARADH
ncbi:SMI1/KNR4 family protein [Streptomyces coeruleorubidus]|uniref:SMI1/KNR4 family protein n=1 Tax=Streptomyces coeruleorubidus TaxID=116188 RepID=UPI003700F73F